MLDYSWFDNFRMHVWTSGDQSFEERAEQEESLDISRAQYALDEAKKRVEKANKKQEEIDNLKYEKELILGNVFEVIREDVAQSYFNIFRYLNTCNLIWMAWKYSKYKDENRLSEIEEEHKKEPKYNKPLEDFENAFDFVIRTIKDKLIPNKYKEESNLVEIVDWNYSEAYEFTFNCKGVDYTICVPMFEKTDEKNYLEMLNGYTLRFRESEYCIGLAFYTLNPKEFKEKLEKWITDRLVEKDTERLEKEIEAERDESKD